MRVTEGPADARQSLLGVVLTPLPLPLMLRKLQQHGGVVTP